MIDDSDDVKKLSDKDLDIVIKNLDIADDKKFKLVINEKYSRVQSKRESIKKAIQENNIRRLESYISFKNPLEVEINQPSWLWPGRIAKGKLCIIGGLPGVGKSQFTMWLTSLITNGGIWPLDKTSCNPGTVLFLSDEDDFADTQIPRLMANGANLKKVFKIDGILDKKGHVFYIDLNQHLPQLEEFIKTFPDLQALIIDPITDFMGDINANSNTEVRNFLNKLAKLASKYNFALICLTHLNKGNSPDIQSKMLGAMAFTGVARSAYLICKDPSDESRRYFVPVKNNLGNDESGYVYKIGIKTISDNDFEMEAPFVEWLDEKVTKTANDILAEAVRTDSKSNQELSNELLLDMMKLGPQPSNFIYETAENEGIPPWCIKKSANTLGIKKRAIGFGKGKYNEWYLDGQNAK